MDDPPRSVIPPVIDADSAGWWEGVRRGVITLQQCGACRRFRFPPLPSCPYCGCRESEETTASGLGRIYSWVTVHRSLAPEFVGEEPYTIVTVELDEGPRIFGRLVDGRPDAGERVKATFYSVDQTVLVGFVPTMPEGGPGDSK
jgi:uncharacterized OB-fold protein